MRTLFLILLVVASVNVISAQETLYKSNVPLLKKDGGQKVSSIDVEIVYQVAQDSYILQLGKTSGLKDASGNPMFLWLFSKETEGKVLQEKWSGIANGKKEKFNALIPEGPVSFSFSGEKRIASKENIPFAFSGEAPEKIELTLSFYIASIDKKNNEQLAELLPVNIKFDRYKEKQTDNVTADNAGTSPKKTVFEVDTEILEADEEDMEMLLAERKGNLNTFITESNIAIQKIYDEINQLKNEDTNQARKDSLELIANAINEKVQRRKTNQDNINILETEAEIEDKFSQFDVSYNQINKKLVQWESDIVEKKNSKQNWWIIIGVGLAFVMMFFSVLTQVNAKLEAIKQKKKERKEKKALEEEKAQQLLNDDDIPGI